MDISGFSGVTERVRGLVMGYEFTHFATTITAARYL